MEPALLLLLRDGPKHGYELAESLPDLVSGETPDMGNLYRMLRHLEEEGIVTSEWGTEGSGPARRTYRITTEGTALLDAWGSALSGMRTEIDGFLERWSAGR